MWPQKNNLAMGPLPLQSLEWAACNKDWQSWFGEGYLIKLTSRKPVQRTGTYLFIID